MNIITFDARGHMGQIVCARVEEKGWALTKASHRPEGEYVALSDISAGDCLVDFSNHAAVEDVCAAALRLRIPLVEATTGYSEEEKLLLEKAAQTVPIFFSSIMSVGVIMLLRLAKEAAKAFPTAEIEIVEAHHNRKLDVPSGTALMLAESIKSVRPETTYNIGRPEGGKRTPEEIGIHSLRMGNVVGMHEVIINAGSQTISLKHEAHDRALFADGALSAVEFLLGKAPGLYSMDDMV